MLSYPVFRGEFVLVLEFDGAWLLRNCTQNESNIIRLMAIAMRILCLRDGRVVSMTVMKHFLGNRDHSISVKQPEDPERPDTDNQSLFFKKPNQLSKSDAGCSSDLPLYVSSKGYFFH